MILIFLLKSCVLESYVWLVVASVIQAACRFWFHVKVIIHLFDFFKEIILSVTSTKVYYADEYGIEDPP